jgi:dTDP-4-dehydrorhamnose reductase
MKRVIVIGANGLAGTNIIPLLGRYWEIVPLDIEDWDITDRAMGASILDQYVPGALINLAAYTDVDGCEDHVEMARKVNGEAPGIIAELCRERSVKLVHMSTDYVFDGSKNLPYNEEDVPNPSSMYGLTKLEGERRVRENCPSALIARTEWLYGDGGANFITKVAQTAREKGTVNVVDDQRGSPTYAKDLAEPLRLLIEKGGPGVYHVTNSGSCTWFEFAKEIFRRKGIRAEVQPITSAQLNRRAKRPAYSVLDCSRLQRETGLVLRTWQEALADYLG